MRRNALAAFYTAMIFLALYSYASIMDRIANTTVKDQSRYQNKD